MTYCTLKNVLRNKNKIFQTVCLNEAQCIYLVIFYNVNGLINLNVTSIAL